MVKVDLSKIASNDVPVGEYTVTLTKATVRDNKDKSGQHIMFELTISDDDATDLNGRKLFTNCSFKDQALWKLKETLVAFDADPEIFDAPIDIEELTQNLYGNQATAVVVENTSGAGASTQVAKVRAIGF